MYTVYDCPLNACHWSLAVEHLELTPNSIADALGLSAIGMDMNYRYQQMAETERNLHDHLVTHTPEEWLPELIAAREQAESK